ncbi:sn-glycerol-3-phosphate ABC transporter ATP-binding protein UgpC [Ensifer adhaerens]|uniref:ABC transporter ATP-binding protein n=1 Tax=Ensifer adhaerens TaxID=106592 RepID=UPI001CBA6F95|nr:sn-glycerol-3-phosphate ABC transporter ATP-binding protein UgpC [Ensifer adhaerens]MBZ7926290.1 sn-glycerol-3-phosphate ABC transporter ATP-binding protein UgpC [Ensifer adhaerens]UAX97350.1 sn-glycerol-3-phosphate ABC transporter ATP-binding protein UgpC [Ensifer adhaerens]UAY03531.1 sn-glycerol-3-phosphate ABC transporter ATP-binding protein UgpC [Ensifer adhaerens]UAY11515.1 sn-glycerol-3-phosphate ABC transporter ATP-binding protein UgpC [Ensifer adhaerens]
MAKVQLKNLEKIYGNAFKAVHGINLDIEDGEFMVFVGPSGCAKSTTLRMVAGLEEISGGEVVIGDQRVNDLPPGKRSIAMVFQNYALYPHMKVRGNLAFGLKIAGKPNAEIEAAIDHVAKILEIEPLLDRLPKQLSGGQAQRVALGRALIKKPGVFLFDEPLSNLDAKLRASMRVRITDLHRQLKAEGLSSTVIYVTHDQTEAMTMGDRICVMQAGRIMQVATPKELYNRPANLFVAGFIGSPEMNLIDARLEGGDFSIGSQRLPLGSNLATRLSSRPAEAVLGMRPQHLSLAADGAAFAVKLTNAEFMGHEVYLHADLEGRKLVSVVGAAEFEALGRSDVIRLRPDPAQLHVFDKADGRNVSL